MNIRDYIDIHYKEIKRKVKLVTKNHLNYEDLLNDMILTLLEKSPDLHHQLLRDDKVQHWIVRSCKIQFNSSTSPFHHTYRNQNDNIENVEIPQEEVGEVEDIDGLTKDIKIYIGKLPHYHRTIAEQHFLEGKSQRELSRYYNINRIHISRDVTNIQKNIKAKFNRDKYKK